MKNSIRRRGAEDSDTVPRILKERLLFISGMMVLVLAVGLFMEKDRSGEGFLKLTLLCVLCLGCRFVLDLIMVYKKSYLIIEGRVMGMKPYKGGKSYYEVWIQDEWEHEDCLVLPVKCGIKKGEAYRFYMKDGVLLGIAGE